MEVEKKAFQEASYQALNQDQQRIVDSAKNVSVLVQLFEDSNRKNTQLQQKVNEQLREIRELKEVNREQFEQINKLHREMVALARTNATQTTRQTEQQYDREDDFSL